MRILLVGAALLLAGCSSSGPALVAPSLPDLPSSYRIVYYVGGSATGADLTLNIDGQESQENGVGVPVHNKDGELGLRFTTTPSTFLYVSAQNKGGGTITCRITENGRTVAVNQASGEYAIVTCDAMA